MLQLVIMRGLPGSGKTTLANKIAEQKRAVVYATDDYFIEEDKVYRYYHDRTKEAHQWNIDRTKEALQAGRSVIVDNTNYKKSHMEPYLELAEKFKAKVSIVTAPLNSRKSDFLAYNNIHNVSESVIKRMRKEWEE